MVLDYVPKTDLWKGFFDSLSAELELKHHDVQVTIICPGVVRTDLNRTRLESTYPTKTETGMPAEVDHLYYKRTLYTTVLLEIL
jgi:short-subunit dehydrogenase